MRRLLPFAVLLYLLLVPTGAVHAGLATHAKGTIGGADAFKMITGRFAGFSIFGKVFPIVIKTNENNVPDLQPFSIFGDKASPWTEARAVQLNTKHYTSDNYVSGKYCAKLVVKPPWGDKVVGFDLTENTTEVSENYPYSQRYAETGQKLSSYWGFMRTVPSTTGQYDYDWPTHVVSTISTFDCYLQDTGNQDDQNVIGVNSLAEFPEAKVESQYTGPTLTETVWKRIQGVLQQVEEVISQAVPMILEVTKKQRDGSVTSAHCFWGRCDSGHAQGDDLVKMADIKGNFTAGLAPIKEVLKQVIPDATEDQDIQIQSGVPFSKKDTMTLQDVFYNRAAAKTDTTTFLCGVVPKDKQDKLVLGNKDSNLPLTCNPTPTPTPSGAPGGGWNCRTNLPEQASAALNAAGQNWADNGIYSASCKTENAWKLCHNDVISRAKKACVDPVFALAIWLHESAASNYKCGLEVLGNKDVQDFGINGGGVPPNDFSAQLDRFLKLDYACPRTIEDWVSMYYIGNNCYAEEPDKAKVDGYVAELQDYYTQLGGGTLPSWPKGSCSN